MQDLDDNELDALISEIDADVDVDAEDAFWQKVEKETKGCEQDVDDEDVPDYEFEDGEKRSKVPNYTFCPAPHRPPILHIFTKHSSAIRSSLLALATQRREGKSASAPSKRCICTANETD